MVGGPPCPRCGFPLRWFAPQNAWGCDRCQQMFPAQAVQPMPQQPMPQQPGPAMQAPPGAPRKSRAMLFAIGGGVAVVAIIVIAVVASGKSKKKGGVNESWLDSVEDAAEKICACKDDACVTQAIDDLEYLKKNIGELHLNSEQQARSDELAKKMLGCAKKGPGSDKSHKSAKANSDAFNDVMDGIRHYRAKMCSCKDADCARQVKADYEVDESEWKKSLGDVDISADDEKMMKHDLLEFFTCEAAAKKNGGD